MMDVKDYTIIGETNYSLIIVELNNKKIDKIYLNGNKFKYKLNDFILINGWNYFRFVVEER